MSTSPSPNKAFWRALVLVIGGLSVGILVLALLVTTSGPRVRHVAVQNQSGDEIASVGQGLTLVFDRPIEGTDFESAIEFAPEVDYTVSHRQGQLSITFDQNLLSNTDYVLTIRPEIEDDLGRRMDGEYSYEFTTEEPSFTYLERNYGRGAVDRIIQRAPLSGESQVLFGEDRIKGFARNGRYLAVIVPRRDNTDELRVYDLATLEERSVEIPPDVRVENLRFSPVDNQLVFIPRALGADVGDPDSEAFADNNKLYRYDIDGEQLQPIDTSSDRGNVESALYSRDGQALLYKTIDGSYYLTGATRTTETTPLGIYQASGGFDGTNTKIAFQFGNDVTIYDAQAKESQELPGIGIGGSISAPTFLHNSEELLYLWDPLNEKEGTTTQVYVASADGNVEEQVVESQPPERFFDNPVISHDDRYVLVEATSEPSKFELDDYAGNRQPEDTRLILYDRLEREVIDSDTHGIDPVWDR
jgi:Bacterial Ig-like domain